MKDELKFVGKLDNYNPITTVPFAHGRTSSLWKAKNTRNNIVCVKQFYSYTTFGEEKSSYERFKRELNILSSLSHPNVLQIIDYNVERNNSNPFIVLPLCDGDLRNIMEGTQFMSPVRIICILEQIASAIDTAHRSGIVHGDIKPENVLHINNASQFYLADFSISKFTGFHENLTIESGFRGGTTNYLSPERLRELSITTSSDIYSFAVMAFEMFTGSLPFDTKLPLFQQMETKIKGNILKPLKLNPNLDNEIASILQYALSVNPAERPKTASELCSMLKKELPFNKKRKIRLSHWNELSQSNKIVLIVGLVTAISVIIAALL